MSTASTSTDVRHEFQAEVKQLLDLMVHSLYSDKDIFLRELISNASDALDKLRFEALTRPELGERRARDPPRASTPTARTLTISDNGIGMTRDEVVKNIGTIAQSRHPRVPGRRSRRPQSASPELIGQFGVGFYSAFMVAERDRAGHPQGRRGRRHALGVDRATARTRIERRPSAPPPGTTVTLHLKPADPEHGLRDYATEPTSRAHRQALLRLRRLSDQASATRRSTR